MKAVSIISLIMLVVGIGFAIVGELGILAAIFLIPTSFIFLVMAKIIFLITAKVNANKKDDLAVQPASSIKTANTISLTMLIISAGLGAFYYWGTYTQAKYERFNDIAGIIPVSALFLSILFFIIALLLLPLAKFFTRMIALSKSSHSKIKDK